MISVALCDALPREAIVATALHVVKNGLPCILFWKEFWGVLLINEFVGGFASLNSLCMSAAVVT